MGERFYTMPIAHRGLHDGNVNVIENSMQAFKLAIEKGFNIETDVRLLTDGKLAIFHDSNMKRVTGKRVKIQKLSSKDLEKPEYFLPNGEKVPLFEDLLELVDGKVDILCEIKAGRPTDFALEKMLYSQIKGKPWVTIQSFNPYSVHWFTENAPEVRRGILGEKAKNFPLRILYKLVNPYWVLCVVRPDFLAYHIDFLPSKRIEIAVKGFNLKLLSWTIKNDEFYTRAEENNCDNIIFERLDIDAAPYKEQFPRHKD
ncbi:MAG: hypothetical protein LBN25_02975 [Christensenellaceae bacterium]|jgi:glycerophosphoryl diester phosphodiesterase|nr:hypothetical protein [Christensenellaceae bacterium]